MGEFSDCDEIQSICLPNCYMKWLSSLRFYCLCCAPQLKLREKTNTCAKQTPRKNCPQSKKGILREYMWLFPFSPQSSVELRVALLCSKEINVFLGGVRDKELPSSNHMLL